MPPPYRVGITSPGSILSGRRSASPRSWRSRWDICIIPPAGRCFYVERNVRKVGEVHESFLLWRKRASMNGVVREVRCSVDHLGEDFYELRLLGGQELLLNESFRDLDELLVRAEELRNRKRPGRT